MSKTEGETERSGISSLSERCFTEDDFSSKSMCSYNICGVVCVYFKLYILQYPAYDYCNDKL